MADTSVEMQQSPALMVRHVLSIVMEVEAAQMYVLFTDLHHNMYTFT